MIEYKVKTFDFIGDNWDQQTAEEREEILEFQVELLKDVKNDIDNYDIEKLRAYLKKTGNTYYYSDKEIKLANMFLSDAMPMRVYNQCIDFIEDVSKVSNKGKLTASPFIYLIKMLVMTFIISIIGMYILEHDLLSVLLKQFSE